MNSEKVKKMRLALIIGLLFLSLNHLQAADLSGRYHPILQKGILWEENYSYFGSNSLFTA